MGGGDGSGDGSRDGGGDGGDGDGGAAAAVAEAAEVVSVVRSAAAQSYAVGDARVTCVQWSTNTDVKLTSDRRNVAHVGGRGGRTFAPAVALAVEEGSPSSAVRLGPIHWMGRAVRSKAHALSGHTMPAPMSSKSASAAISDRVQDHVQRAKHSSAW